MAESRNGCCTAPQYHICNKGQTMGANTEELLRNSEELNANLGCTGERATFEGRVNPLREEKLARSTLAQGEHEKPA